jgi:hypothetical protein
MSPVRTHAYDVGKFVAVWAAWFWSLNWNAIGAFLSAMFTLLLILDKLGMLAPLKAFGGSVWRRLAHAAEAVQPWR